jgi:membrane protease YdiL (CAAX protease family)
LENLFVASVIQNKEEKEKYRWQAAIAVIGNLITGSVFGWVFRRRGLLIAIMSHISFDLIFQAIGTPYS